MIATQILKSLFLNKMACVKSSRDVGIAVFLTTVIIFAFGTTFYGVFRYAFNLEDDKNFNRQHLLLGGNLLQAASLVGTIAILSKAQSGPVKLGLMLGMFVTLILILYMTNVNPTDPASQWTAMVLLTIDVYMKITALFLGFGVCSPEDIPKVLGQMTTTVMGGNKRR